MSKTLWITFEDGRVAVHLDRESTLNMIENYLRKKFALQSGTTARLHRSSFSNSEQSTDLFDGELRLPNRHILVKFLTDNANTDEQVKIYTEKAKSMNPSEIWLFGTNDQKVEITFEPVFTENSVLRGKLKMLGLSEVFSEVIGKHYDVIARSDKSQAGGFTFLVSKSN